MAEITRPHKQPLIVYKSKNGKDLEIRRFMSTVEAKRWLRKEGCSFSNGIFASLENDSVTLTTEEFEYDIQVSAMSSCRRISGERRKL